MAYGKNGASCWLAGAVRTLQKRVEWLEAATTGANTSVSRHKLDGDCAQTQTSGRLGARW